MTRKNDALEIGRGEADQSGGRFVDGIYNYCDRWCERCSFTSRCRVFAMELALPAPESAHSDDPPDFDGVRQLLRELGGALRELLAEHGASDEELRALSGDDESALVESGLQNLIDRANAYSGAVSACYTRALARAEAINAPGIDEVVATIVHYAFFVPVKVERAIRSQLLARRARQADWAADALGSMKVALIAIERSIEAWRDLEEAAALPVQDAVRMRHDLAGLRLECESAIPDAMDFIRPGLDSPAN
jgi:hypothetical protein